MGQRTITLEKMKAADFAAFNSICIGELSGALGNRYTPEEAALRAEAEQKELLPLGADTEGQHLFSIKSSPGDGAEYPEDGTAGGLWFAPMRRGGADFAFLFFIHISAELRGTGTGSEAMRLLEDEVRSLGLPAVRLHVLKSNAAALGVYEKAGYRLFTDYDGYEEDDPGIIMEKVL